MKLLYCSPRSNFTKSGSDYYADGEWPYLIPALSQFFAPMYLMVPVHHHQLPWTSKLDKAPSLQVVETKTFQNETAEFFQEAYFWSLRNVLKFREWQAQADAVLIVLPSAVPYLAYLPLINKPLITLVVGDEQEVIKASGHPIAKVEKFTGLLKFREILEGYLLKKSAAIICRSSELKKRLCHRYNLPESKIKVIFSGIDTDLFKPFPPKQRAEIRQNLGLKNNLVIGFVAALIMHSKGVDTLIKASHQLRAKYPKVKLLLIGRDIIDFKREQSIVYCGRLKREDMPAYYNAMDIFLFPSRSEGAPKVVMEASACGIPVISTNVGGIPELIKRGETGFLVDPEDVSGIVGYCQMLLGDEELRKRMSKEGRKCAIENFDYRKLAQKTADVIKNTVGSI